MLVRNGCSLTLRSPATKSFLSSERKYLMFRIDFSWWHDFHQRAVQCLHSVVVCPACPVCYIAGGTAGARNISFLMARSQSGSW